ncbi:vascular cell adhesion protein 1 [Embiotoca jacksoni]|uniref:vascular cell adhesion protein 1 n=1 Tax=Embiotoca jacksoni TaxID=100190 RepID=UPI0037047587
MLPLRMLGLLMLCSFLLCDADSTCPTERNPLVLDPPEIIEEYGKSVLVNCSTTFEKHDGMYWRAGNQSFDTKKNEGVVSKLVELSDWNLKFECKVKLNDSLECSKELKVTVYKNPEVLLFVKHTDAAAEETQYDLQCDVSNVAPVQNLNVRWYKNNKNIRNDSFKSTTETPENKSFVLVVNISRIENVAPLRCEAQLDFGPDGPQLPVISQTLNISSYYAPEFNTKNETDEIVVYKGENITLTCEAEGNPAPVIHWSGDGLNIPEDSNNLTITRINASSNYTCTASNYLGNITKQIRVHVIQRSTEAPIAMPIPNAPTPRAERCPLTLTPSEIVVRFGDPVSINCRTSATDAAGIGWEATVGGTGFQLKSTNLTWEVEKLEEWDFDASCYITLKNETQCSLHPNITLYQTPDTVSVSALDHGPMLEDTQTQLKCNIHNVAPVQKLEVKWYRDNETVSTQSFNDFKVTPVNVSSTMTFTPLRGHNGSIFRCKAELHLGPKGPEVLPTVTSAPYTAVVHYKPLIKGCPSSYTTAEHKFSLDMLHCETDGNPPSMVQWYYKGELVNSSKHLTRNDSGTYTAVAENVLGRSSASVYITVEYKPSFTCNDRYVLEVNEKLQTCEPEGLPPPTVIWFKEGKMMASPLHWTKHDSGEYLLKADNTHGTAEHKLYVNVLYAPEFKEENKTKMVILGENATLDCSAEGNPLPEVQWKYTAAVNVIKSTVGRQKIITVTGATSTNAGVYICVATNKFGNVTRSVTLVMQGKTNQIPSVVIWGLLIILAILIIFILLVFYRKHQGKHGQYNFIPDKGSDIPMTPAGETT